MRQYVPTPNVIDVETSSPTDNVVIDVILPTPCPSRTPTVAFALKHIVVLALAVTLTNSYPAPTHTFVLPRRLALVYTHSTPITAVALTAK